MGNDSYANRDPKGLGSDDNRGFSNSSALEVRSRSDRVGFGSLYDPWRIDCFPSFVVTDMPARSTWNGFLKISLVSVPVEAFSAISANEGEFHFNQLHETCHSRIKYVKTCPIHGPVGQDEIVSGYEYEKGHFVVIEKTDLSSLRSEEEKTAEIQVITSAGGLNPIYLTDRTYFLVPDGTIAQKPYAVIERCLREQKRIAIAHRVVNGKDEMVLIRPSGGLLTMTVLNNAVQIRSPDEYFEDVSSVDVSTSELKLTRSLFDVFYRDEVDMAPFKDHYDERVAELVEARIKGRKVIHVSKDEPPRVINLMDALKQSLHTKKGRKSTSAEAEMAQIKRAIVAAKRRKPGNAKGA